MPKYPYQQLGEKFDRDYRNQLNQNFIDIEEDVKTLGSAATEALEAAEEAHTQALYAKQEADRLVGTDVSVLDNRITTIDAQLAEKAKQSDLDTTNQNVALKANQTDLISTDAKAIDAQTKANNPLGQITDNTIPASKLKQASDADKIKLANLAQEVRDAMTGTTSIGTTPTDGSVTTTKIANGAVEFNKLAKQALNINLIPSDSIPDYNQTTKTFNFNSLQYYEAVLVYGNNYYAIPSGTTVINSTGSSAVKLIFNTTSKAFSFVAHHASIGLDDIVLAVIRDKNQWVCHITAPFNTTINGKKIGDKTTVKMMLNMNVLVGGPNLPNVDNVNKKLIIPSNTYDWVVYVGSDYYANAVPSTGVTIDLSSATGTSAWTILYNLTTKAFNVVAYDNIESYSQTHVIFATFRIVNEKYYFTMPCPFFVDGKLYGMDLNENQPNTTIENRLDAFVKAVAHRGYSTIAPENTLPAYSLAKQKGFSYVECDVDWTSDNIPVLIHDQTIDRTSDGTGNINYMTFEQARSYDFGSWKSSEYAGTKIPSFEEFIILCKKLNLHPYIELKGGIDPTRAQILVDIVKKTGMVKNVTWISFASTYLETLLTVLPTARIGLVGTMTQQLIDKAKTMKTEVNDVFVNADNYLLTSELVQSALMDNIPVETWTVNNQSRVLELVEMGVSGIATDTLNIAEILST